MNTQKYVFEFTGTVTLKQKGKEPVVYPETFYAIAETSGQAGQRLAHPNVSDLAYTGKSTACNKDW